jgi:hypothetical protein
LQVFFRGGVFMIWGMNNCSNELGEILNVLDESVQLLNHVSKENELAMARAVRQKVEWTLEKVIGREWVEIHSELRELIYYLDLTCFSLLNMRGESFPVYLQEVNQRYSSLLRSLYELYQHRMERCRTNSMM